MRSIEYQVFDTFPPSEEQVTLWCIMVIQRTCQGGTIQHRVPFKLRLKAGKASWTQVWKFGPKLIFVSFVQKGTWYPLTLPLIGLQPIDVRAISLGREETRDLSPFPQLRSAAASRLLTGVVCCYLQAVPEDFLAEGWLAQSGTGRDHTNN